MSMSGRITPAPVPPLVRNETRGARLAPRGLHLAHLRTLNEIPNRRGVDLFALWPARLSLHSSRIAVYVRTHGNSIRRTACIPAQCNRRDRFGRPLSMRRIFGMTCSAPIDNKDANQRTDPEERVVCLERDAVAVVRQAAAGRIRVDSVRSCQKESMRA